MADVTITVDGTVVAITPEEVTVRIDSFLKFIDFVRILDLPKVNAVLDFTNKVARKPFVAKAITLAFEIYNENWKNDIQVLTAELKK